MIDVMIFIASLSIIIALSIAIGYMWNGVMIWYLKDQIAHRKRWLEGADVQLWELRKDNEKLLARVKELESGK